MDLIKHLYSNKKLVAEGGEVLLLAPANRDTGLLLVPDLGPSIRVASAPTTPAGTPPLPKRERNCSDPTLTADQLRSHFEGFKPRHGTESRSSPPSLYVEDVDVNQNEVIYETVSLPPKQKAKESALMKKKQSILSEVFKMFQGTLYKEFGRHDCLTLAKHMTRRDLEVVWGEGFCKKPGEELKADSPSGLELILFPQGSELRRNILKRSAVFSLNVLQFVHPGKHCCGTFENCYVSSNVFQFVHPGRHCGTFENCYVPRMFSRFAHSEKHSGNC